MIMKIVRIDMPLIRSRCLPWVQGAEAEKDNVTIVQILNSGRARKVPLSEGPEPFRIHCHVEFKENHAIHEPGAGTSGLGYLGLGGSLTKCTNEY